MFICCLSHFCEIHGPTAIISTARHTTPPAPVASPKCDSCSLSLPSDATSIASPSYTSSGSYYSPLILASLLLEHSVPGSPTFHGNPSDGYCIHLPFSLPDTTARGQERKYALMVLSDSESDLLANWLLISTYFAHITNILHACVNKVPALAPSNTIFNEPYLRRLPNRPRLLCDLTNDPLIFAKFHLWHSELLLDIAR